MKPVKDWNKFREQFVRWTLRRASFRWPPRGEALKSARVERGQYRCAGCRGIFKNKEVKLDHIEPVVEILSSVRPSNGETRPIDLASFVRRLFVEASGFQVLCGECHARKTADENTQRKVARQLARKERTWAKGRSREANVEPTAVEGAEGNGQGIDFRSDEVQPQWVADCSRCERSIYGSTSKALGCPTCGRRYRPRKRA